MPAREPTYYRWAEDKPCTTNQTYGYELRSGITGNSPTCPLCVAEAAAAEAATAAAAKRQAERQQRQTEKGRRDGGVKHSDKVQCKPINKGYTVGHMPIRKRLQASSGGAGGQRGAAGATSSFCEQHDQSDSKDLYLWHALSGTIVCCRNDEHFDE